MATLDISGNVVIQAKCLTENILEAIKSHFQSLENFENINDLNNVLDCLDAYLNIEDAKRPHLDLEPLFNTIIYLLKECTENQDELIKKFCKIILDHKNKHDVVHFNSIYNLFNLIEDKRHIRYEILCVLIQISKKPLFIVTLKNLKHWFSLWRLKYEEKRNIRQLIYNSYVQNGQAIEGLNFLVDFYKQLTSKDKNDNELKDDIKQCIILHLQQAEIYLFDQLNSLPNFSSQDNILLRLFNIFMKGDINDYLEFYSNETNKKYLEENSLDHVVLEEKIRILTFLNICLEALNKCTLNEQAFITMDAIGEKLQIKPEKVEEFVIGAIRTKLVRCRIDEVNHMVKVYFATYRAIGSEQWKEMGGKVNDWLETLQLTSKQLYDLWNIQGIEMLPQQQQQQQMTIPHMPSPPYYGVSGGSLSSALQAAPKNVDVLLDKEGVVEENMVHNFEDMTLAYGHDRVGGIERGPVEYIKQFSHGAGYPLDQQYHVEHHQHPHGASPPRGLPHPGPPQAYQLRDREASYNQQSQGGYPGGYGYNPNYPHNWYHPDDPMYHSSSGGYSGQAYPPPAPPSDYYYNNGPRYNNEAPQRPYPPHYHNPYPGGSGGGETEMAPYYRYGNAPAPYLAGPPTNVPPSYQQQRAPGGVGVGQMLTDDYYNTSAERPPYGGRQPNNFRSSRETFSPPLPLPTYNKSAAGPNNFYHQGGIRPTYWDQSQARQPNNPSTGQE